MEFYRDELVLVSSVDYKLFVGGDRFLLVASGRLDGCIYRRSGLF